MSMRVLNLSCVLVLGVGAWSGCSKGADEPAPAATVGNEEAPPVLPATGAGPMTKLTDGQIAQILGAVDDVEIEQAKLALEKSSDPGVRGYANHMIEQHTASKSDGASLASQTGMKLAESPKAKELEAKGATVLSELKAADAKNFDITYLKGQEEQHAEVLTLIKDQLLPAVNDPALRDHLAKTRGVVTEHLDKAKELQKQ
jgi:putative membrane protein